MPPVTETLGTKHVERYGIGMGAGLGAKYKSRLRVDEAPDQPRGRNSIDARARPGHPQPVQVFGKLRFRHAARSRTLRLLRLRQQFLKLAAQGIPEEVDILKLLEPASNPIQASGRSLR